MSGGDDTLSRVALSHSAVKRWHERAGDLAREAKKIDSESKERS